MKVNKPQSRFTYHFSREEVLMCLELRGCCCRCTLSSIRLLASKVFPALFRFFLQWPTFFHIFLSLSFQLAFILFSFTTTAVFHVFFFNFRFYIYGFLAFSNSSHHEIHLSSISSLPFATC